MLSGNLFVQMVQHPFNLELAAGTLAQQKFITYLQQDELYIKDYTKALFNLVKIAPNRQAKDILTGFAEDGYLIEKELHETFFRKYGIESITIKNKACQNYTDFLLSQTSQFALGIVALLPCFRMYREVGLRLNNIAMHNNPYQSWLDTYTGAEFELQVDKMLNLVNEVAETASLATKQQMEIIYLHSCRLELEFWAGAYGEE